MLALKKKKEEAAAAAASEAANASAAGSASPAAAGAGSSTGGGSGSADGAPTAEDVEKKKVSLFGGDDARRAAGGAAGGTKRKMTPGEIRVQKDILELDGGKVGQVTFPDPKDVTSMVVKISPEQGYWKGASFEFTIKVPDFYPHNPPKVHCVTRVYHPNIDLEGHVCLNILRDEWKPIFTINHVIYGIIYLFYEPNPNDPLNHEAAALFRDNLAQFERNVYSSLRGGRVGATTFPKLL